MMSGAHPHGDERFFENSVVPCGKIDYLSFYNLMQIGKALLI
jgi:hypothetical protein